jgi:hypothetical protein
MRLILLSGSAGAGKDTMADALTQNIPQAKKISLASGVKETLSCFLACPIEDLDDRTFKESSHPRLMGKTVREAMQTLGTCWGREMIHPDVWVNVAKDKIEGEWKKSPKTTIVIPDIRYDTEAESLKKIGGVLIKVERPDNPNETISNQHSSEKGISEQLVDWKFINSKPSIKESQLEFIEFMKLTKVLTK